MPILLSGVLDSLSFNFSRHCSTPKIFGIRYMFSRVAPKSKKRHGSLGVFFHKNECIECLQIIFNLAWLFVIEKLLRNIFIYWPIFKSCSLVSPSFFVLYLAADSLRHHLLRQTGSNTGRWVTHWISHTYSTTSKLYSSCMHHSISVQHWHS